MKVSEFLKNNTKSLHDAVEKGFNSNKIFEKTFDFEDYKKLIYYNYLFIKNFEDLVFDNISPEFAEKISLENRRKLNALVDDIQQLKIPEKEKYFETVIENEFEALGILYVIEGSTLGGNVIAKQLSKTAGFENIAFNYFRIYGEKTGEYWKNFKETLDSEITENQYDKILEGTEKAYKFLLDLF